jgi:phytoene dehydrogenase-like protein
VPDRQRDVLIVGGGHNALVAAILLARAGLSVGVLERAGQCGGAAVSGRVFHGHDAHLSRYAYLVSLFPRWLREELGLSVELRERPGLARRSPALRDWHERMAALAERVAPTLTRPLLSREAFQAVVADPRTWEDVFERPLGVALERELADDWERGFVLTDATIGTFASAHDPRLRQNRCFLYHVIGDGRGDWRVPVGGMGALTDALVEGARAAGAELCAGVEVTEFETDGDAVEVRCADGAAHHARHLLLNAAREPVDPPPEGSQLKINMLLERLPRLRDPGLDPGRALAGTFHVNQGYEQLEAAYAEAAAGLVPTTPPCELYCHSLIDGSILGPELRAAGAHTLTLFGLHMPARLFGGDHDAAKRAAVEATLASLNTALAEPIEPLLLGLEALTPVELEAELGMPGGHIFHRDLQWPFAGSEGEVGQWGVETERPNVWRCGAAARRGGGVSGIPGHNAARAVLAALGRT